MTDRGISFTAGSVQALRGGRKTQTRRLLRPQPDARTTRCHVDLVSGMWMGIGPAGRGPGTSQWEPWRLLPWRTGDRLWVRERFTFVNRDDEPGRGPEVCIGYPADGPDLPNRPTIPVSREAFDRTDAWPFRPRERLARHMPRWASRLTLTVEALRIERLQDITEADALAEGAPDYAALCEASAPGARNTAGETAAETAARLGWASRWYRTVWSSIHGPRAWAENPWVVATTFAIERRNIDAAPTSEAADA